MMRKLKEKLVLHFLERKKRKEPFDAASSELYELPPNADIHQNNSHFFTANSTSGETLSMRLGMRNHSQYEVFVLFRTADGRFFVHEKDHFTPEECPVKFECIDIASKWHISFNGCLRDMVTSELVDASADVEFTATCPIYDFIYHADRFNGMASSIAREKWNRTFFTEVRKNDQRHYEQAGSLSGEMKIGLEKFNLNLCCVRDHSFGRREWDMMNEHIWFLGMTENNKILCFSIVNYPAMKRIYSGYTNFFCGKMETLRDYETLEYDENNGLGPDSLKLRCIFSENRVLDVQIIRDSNVKCLFGGGCYAFQEGLGTFIINGVRGRGTIEYGFNANPSRWEGYEMPIPNIRPGLLR